MQKPKDEIQANLQRTVVFLAGEVGERGYLRTGELDRSAEYISAELRSCGYTALNQAYDVKGRSYCNVYAEKQGLRSPGKIIVAGAHYDVVIGLRSAVEELVQD